VSCRIDSTRAPTARRDAGWCIPDLSAKIFSLPLASPHPFPQNLEVSRARDALACQHGFGRE